MAKKKRATKKKAASKSKAAKPIITHEQPNEDLQMKIINKKEFFTCWHITYEVDGIVETHLEMKNNPQFETVVGDDGNNYLVPVGADGIE